MYLIIKTEKMKIIINILILLYSLGSFSQSLEKYVHIALKNNSLHKIKEYDYLIAKEKSKEVVSYENTNFSFGAFAVTPETRVGSQLFKVGLNQKLPWFGLLDSKEELANAQADSKQFDILITDKNLTYQVREAYYNIYKQLAIIKILKDNKQVLKTYERMALAALANNRATMSDVLRIRVQKNELHSKVFQNIKTIEVLTKNFNRLLERDVNKELYVTDSLSALDILLVNQQITKHPILAKIEQTETIFQAQETVIDKKNKPILSVGLDYILVEKRKDIDVNQNGKDVLMPMLNLSIPIFNNRFRSQRKQIDIKRFQQEQTYNNQKNQLEIAFDKAKLAYENAMISLVAAQKNKTEIQRAINVDLKAYETGILNYDKILRLQLQKIKYQLMEIESIKSAFIAEARIKYLVD
jgi:outer membrane protein TolC